MPDFILLTTYFHKYDADIALGLLQSNDIKAMLCSDDAGGFHAHLTIGMGNYRLLVNEKDFDRAKHILQKFNDKPSKEELDVIADQAENMPFQSAVTPSKKSTRNSFLLIPIFVMLLFLALYVIKEIEKKKNLWSFGAPKPEQQK